MLFDLALLNFCVTLHDGSNKLKIPCSTDALISSRKVLSYLVWGVEVEPLTAENHFQLLIHGHAFY